jgi:hypothetical protein
MARLIYIPTAHAPVELGDIYDSSIITRPDLLPEYLGLLDRYWDGIDARLQDEYLDKIYHDSVVKPSPQPFKELAAEGSRNCACVISLLDRGARLMHTESEKLLDMQIRFIGDYAATAMVRDMRDIHVAKRIDKSLRRTEVGVAFFGFDHRIDLTLQRYPRIRVERYDAGLADLMAVAEALTQP